MAEALPNSEFEPDYLDRFSGIGRLYGADAMKRLRAAHVCVIGIGGVGAWTVEALARSGVGRLTLIDLDEICITNVNRQLHAIDGQIGRGKVEAMAERVVRIFPECEVNAIAEFFTANSADRQLSGGIDCVVDAIDSANHKCQLIAACRDRELPLVVSGGAAGQRNPAMVRTGDLAFATNDPLLKRVRKKLRREYGFPAEATKEPFGIPAVFGKENARYPWSDGRVCDTPEPGSDLRLNCESGFGTASFVTGAFGFAAAAEAVKIVTRVG